MTVSVSIEKVRSLMLSTLALRGISAEDAAFIVEDYLESELEGHKTHGVSKFLYVDAALVERVGAPRIVKQHGNYARVDGCRELGHIAALHCANMAISLAKQHGNAIVALDNISRYARLTPFGRKIAQEGYLGIVINNGGPSCVAPFGGRKPIFGTNPVCFSFPSATGKPYVFDFSTAQKVWGEVRQATVENRPLPDGCFLDAEGRFTTDPQRAEAGVPFGGPKGYALCYALELLTGAFIGSKMGLQAADEFDLGYVFLVFSPEMFSTPDAFCAAADTLAADVRACPPMQAGGRVFVPGDPFGNRAAEQLEAGVMELEQDVLQYLTAMSTSLEGGPVFDKRLN